VIHDLAAGKYSVEVQPIGDWYVQQAQCGSTELLNDQLTACEGCDPTAASEPGQARSALDVVYAITYYPSATDANDVKPIMVKPGERVTRISL